MGSKTALTLGDSFRMALVMGVMLLSNAVMMANAEYLRAAFVGEDERRELKVETWNTGAYIFYIAMPIVSGIIGYGTNVVALRLTFFPYKFWG